jgi:hypothetical protein
MKAGTITIEQGGGELSTQTPLGQLNGGAGVRRGLFRITDRAGKTAVIDTTASVTIDDVIKKINTSLEIGVRASLKGDQIVLTDQTGQTTSALTVQDLADGERRCGPGADDRHRRRRHHDHGPATSITSATSQASPRSNDGRGVRRSASGPDFTVTFADASTVSVTLGQDLKTVGQALEAINAASPTKLKAELVPGGNGIKLTDLTGGGTFSIADAAGSKAATDLGIVTASSAGSITGAPVLASMNTVLLSSLNGGSGIRADEPHDHRPHRAPTPPIDLSGAPRPVQDVLDAISNASGVNVTAKLKASGNGIQLVDDSGATGNLVIAAGATADALGLTGSYATTVPRRGRQEPPAAVGHGNTLLSTYNGGKGDRTRASSRSPTPTASKPPSTSPARTSSSIGDVIAKINSRLALRYHRVINANGDGCSSPMRPPGGPEDEGHRRPRAPPPPT